MVPGQGENPIAKFAQMVMQGAGGLGGEGTFQTAVGMPSADAMQLGQGQQQAPPPQAAPQAAPQPEMDPARLQAILEAQAIIEREGVEDLDTQIAMINAYLKAMGLEQGYGQ
jgi:hypothetical protein